MPSIFAHGGGILMLMILSVGFSPFGEGLTSAELPRDMDEFQLNFNDSQQVANVKSSHRGRKLNGNGTFSSRRTHFKSECTNNAIGIYQDPNGYYNGIPQYTVKITSNNCISCGPRDIHIFCGLFASTKLVNPATFKRIAVNDCLLNGGSALPSGQTVTFEYTNLFMYPLKFKSANFCM